MSSLEALIRLQTWLSPSFPTGAFSYSHGLESAARNGLISDQAELEQWLRDLLCFGPGWNDAVLIAESWRTATAGNRLDEVLELSLALAYSKERHLETVSQGRAFLKAAEPWVGETGLTDDCPLPVAVGAVAGFMAIDVELTLSAYLHAYLSNQIQAAMRLMKLGQQGGVELLAKLEQQTIEIAIRAAISSLDDLGSNTFIADIVSMQHEALDSRIFRS